MGALSSCLNPAFPARRILPVPAQILTAMAEPKVRPQELRDPRPAGRAIVFQGVAACFTNSTAPSSSFSFTVWGPSVSLPM